MALENTIKEQDAIRLLELAFERCSKLGIRFSVMDNTLHVANKRIYKAAEEIENEDNLYPSSGKYPTIAYAQKLKEGNYLETVETHKTMDSCGGW